MTTNQGFYTDTDWAFTFTLSEAMAGTFEFSVLPQPGMPSVLDLSYVAASPVTVIPLSVAVDDHAAVKPGLYRVHGTCTAAGGGISWTCEGALKVGRPGDEETYLTIDGTSSGAVSVDVTNAAAYAQAAEESATAAAASEATATTKAAEATASATAAAGSATTATTKAAEASTSAIAAEASATAAAASEATATTKAAEAAASETAAAGSATTATTKATEAATSATAAAASETAAAASEAAAADSAADAAASASSISIEAIQKGASALTLLSAVQRGAKAILLDYATGGYAHADDSSGHELRSVAQVPSVVITNSTGGRIITRKGLVAVAAANTLRLSHRPDGTPAGLLVEAAATNLCKYSEQVDNVNWSKTAGGSGVAPVVTSNAGLAPDGTMTADRVVFNAGPNGASDYSLLQTPTYSVTPGNYAFAPWMKSFDSNTYTLRVSQGGGGAVTCTVTPQWQRFDQTYNWGVSTSTNGRIYTGYSVPGANADILIWGGHIQTGLIVGSYIPTTTAAVSRAADVHSVPISGFTSDEITVGGEFFCPAAEAATRTVMCLYASGTDLIKLAFASGSLAATLTIIAGGTTIYSASLGTLTANTKYKWAAGYSARTNAVRGKLTGLTAVNASPSSSLTPAAPSAIHVGHGAGVDQLNSSILAAFVIDRAWTAAEIAAFTG